MKNTRPYIALRTPMSRDAPGTSREVVGLVVVPAEEFDEQRAGHVEPLGHRGVHLAVEVHPLAGDGLQLPADALGGDDEERQQDQA